MSETIHRGTSVSDFKPEHLESLGECASVHDSGGAKSCLLVCRTLCDPVDCSSAKALLLV